jgi:hypothetical protein
MKTILITSLACFLLTVTSHAAAQVEIEGELKRWHKITLTFDGPEAGEMDEDNPFLNYRLNVTFEHPETERTYVVPGYFAADGNAAETSATTGHKWRVHFAPDLTGTWTYAVQFRKGRFAAVSERASPGVSGEYMDGAKGSIRVGPSDKKGRDFRAKGRLQYIGEHYLRFAGTRDYFLKVGVDAPENFLAYADFDGTFHDDGHKDNLVKTWEPHIRDWKPGDPTWQGGKGKGMIGALNYLASEGLNVFSFLTLNIGGDDRNVFPYIDYNTYDRMDVSKLDQWEIIFEHGQKHGLFLHFKTQEAENQGLLDGGGLGVERRLYYRELIARFGHHLALNWNLGEENGEWVSNPQTPPQFTTQRKAMAQYFFDHDPYRHHVVIHNGAQYDDLLGPDSKLTGPSVQTHFPDFRLVHGDVIKWREWSAAAGKPWAVAVDEPGDAQLSLVPDGVDPVAHENARKNALWGAFMGGAWGIEWYFGYKEAHSDLTCQDFRSRDQFWDQCRILLHFFRDNQIDIWNFQPDDERITTPDAYCMSKGNQAFLVYLKQGGETKIFTHRRQESSYSVRWFNPREGGPLLPGTRPTVSGKGFLPIGLPPENDGQDWVAWITRKN